MAAQTTDLFRKTGAGTVTTLAAPGKALSATSITVGATTNYPTDTGLVIAIRVVDSAGELVAGTYTEWNAIVASGTSFTIEAAPVYGSDQVYPAGSTTQVFIPLSSSAHNDLIDGILTHADQDGTLKAGAVDVAAVLATDVVETAKIKDLNVTTAKIADGAVTPAKLVAGTGTSWVWQSWTPTLSGVFTDGDWTKTCYYIQIGKTVICRIKLVATDATPMAGGGTGAIISLPVTAVDYASTSSQFPIGNGYCVDASASSYFGTVHMTSTTTATVRVHGSGSTYLGNDHITSTAPMTWITNDQVTGTFMYEAA